MIKYVKYAVFIFLAYCALRAYATYSLSTIMWECLSKENSKGANAEQLRQIGVRTVSCVDQKANFVDHLFFNKQDALNSITVKQVSTR